MKKILKSSNTYFFLLLLLSIGIGIQSNLYKIVLIVLLLQWAFSGQIKRKILTLKKNKLGIGLVGIYFLYILSYLWSENKELASLEIIFKSPLIVLPVIMLSHYQITTLTINRILLAFAVSILLFNSFCFAHSFLSFLETGLINDFYYTSLSKSIHTAYQAMFTTFSIVIFVHLFVRDKFISKPAVYFSVTVQMLFILLLSSRMQILIMMVIIPIYLITYYYKRQKVSLGFIYTILIFAFSYLIIKAPSSLNDRYQLTISQIENNNSDPRKYIWAEGLKLIKNNWFFGAGAGDAKNLLVSRYSEKILEFPVSQSLVDSTIIELKKNKRIVDYLIEKSIKKSENYDNILRNYAVNLLEKSSNLYDKAFTRAFNFHNQYLSVFGTVGVFGFSILIFVLLYPFVLSFRNKDYLACLFFFITAASFLTESMLERQAGVSFFAFFYTVMICRFNQSKLS